MNDKLGIFFYALLVGCSTAPDDNSLTIDIGVTDDVGVSNNNVVDVGFDTSVDMEERRELFAGDPCASGVLWSSASDAPFAARDHHATFITERGTPTLHVVGGTNYAGIFDDHWIAEIQNDGSLGEWTESASLPFPRAGQSVVSTGEEVWLITGRDGGGLQPTTLRAVWTDDSISGWVEEAAVPEARFHSAGVFDGSTVWVTGGLMPSGEAQDSVYRATMDDGAITGWETLTLPEPRSHHGAFAKDGELFLALGFQGNAFQNATTPHHDVVKFSAQTGPNITLEPVATMAEDVSTMSVTATGGCVRTFGGLTLVEGSGEYVYQTSSWKLMLDAPGSMLIQQAPMNVGRSHMHQAPYFNGVFYATGGSVAYQSVTSAVEIGRLSR